MSRKKIIAGNWKMNKTPSESAALAIACVAEFGDIADVETVICPTFTGLAVAREKIAGSKIALGAQNLHTEKNGAYTGEISGDMLKDAGCDFVIIGHSERRQYFGENEETVNKKIRAALASGLKPIVCVGETLDVRDAGGTEKLVRTQTTGALAGLTAAELSSMVIAYEPVWAIGTGRVASPAQAQEVHAWIRDELTQTLGADFASKCRIQYGGSVKADNAKEILSQPDVDGALVGGASLDAKGFAAIVKATL